MTENGDHPDLREKIRHSKSKGIPFTVKDWEAEIELRPMTIAQKSSLGVEDESQVKADDMLTNVIIFTVYDPETGTRLFTDEDGEWLKDQPANVIETVALKGLEISGLADDALEAAKKGS